MSFTSRTSAYPNAELFSGVVETTVDALCLVEAARQGKIPRIIRRLSSSERQRMIKSGAVFIFSVEESGIKRWTDSMLWSPSRIDGNFLVYTEMVERAARPNQKRIGDLKPALTRNDVHELSSSPAGSSPVNLAKVGGLLKKTITVTTDDGDLHIVCYFTRADVLSGCLKTIRTNPAISTIYLDPARFLFSQFRCPPQVQVNKRGLIIVVCATESQALLSSACSSSDDGPDEGWPGRRTHDSQPESHPEPLGRIVERKPTEGGWQGERQEPPMRYGSHVSAGWEMTASVPYRTPHPSPNRPNRPDVGPQMPTWNIDARETRKSRDDPFPEQEYVRLPAASFSDRYQDQTRIERTPTNVTEDDPYYEPTAYQHPYDQEWILHQNTFDHHEFPGNSHPSRSRQPPPLSIPVRPWRSDYARSPNEHSFEHCSPEAPSPCQPLQYSESLRSETRFYKAEDYDRGLLGPTN